MNRPHLIIPEIIEQPTWGGDYILKLKGWEQIGRYKGKKIGQSYELYGKSLLSNALHSDELSSIGNEGISKLQDHIDTNPEFVLGKVANRHKTMPLLIKLNQAYGNSFQLHVPYSLKNDRWDPKPESWYYLADGCITLGIREGADIEVYKQTCYEVNNFMMELSSEIQGGALSLDDARRKAKEYVHKKNPWQFVNRHAIKKGQLVDLSKGGIHHSWEEDRKRFPQGNIVFEVQLDASDDNATIRSFDQGSIKDDGTIRKIHIDEYFKYLDTDPERNKLKNHLETADENTGAMMRTDFYAMDSLTVNGSESISLDGSFHHLYVEMGMILVRGGEGEVTVRQGHSCFVPCGLEKYTIRSNKKAAVLKTFIEK